MGALLAAASLALACSPPGESSQLAPTLPGSLQVTVLGLPPAAAAAIAISGAEGYQRQLAAGQTLTGLAAGSYTVTAAEIVSGGDRYVPAPATQTIGVSAGGSSSVQVSYALVTARLQIWLSGIPEAASAAPVLSGPGGYSSVLTGSQLLTGLVPGSYTLHAPAFAWNGDQFQTVPETREIVLPVPDTIPVPVAVAYALASGRLIVQVLGVPPGVAAAVHVSGAGLERDITRTDTLVGLAPGPYSVSAAPLASGGLSYVPAPAGTVLAVQAEPQPAQASISYSSSGATLSVGISGLPPGGIADVRVAGPGGFAQSLGATQHLTGLLAGDYTVSGGSVSVNGELFVAAPAVQVRHLEAGGAAGASVSYSAAPATLTVAISGLPAGVAGAVSISGPGGYSTSLTQSGSLSGLAAGGYDVSATSVTQQGQSYTPSPATQHVVLTGGATLGAAVSYGPAASLDLTITAAYLTQATQRLDGTVPLVAGRNAFLRVFATANQGNLATAQVRVRLYNGTTLLNTYTLDGPSAGVPTAVDEGSLAASWNLAVPAALVQPGLRVLAEVDPGNAIAEGNDANNQFPLSGVPALVDVRALPSFAVRLVPVLQQVNGLQGNVSAANQEQFLADLKKVLPVGAYDADLRAPYTTTAPVLQSSNGNDAWTTVLSEILALRSADASTRYYYGVVKVSYGSGVAGIGYVGGGAKAAIGWDYLPSGAHVMAHEVGHNLGRWHAPCGGPSSTDPSYPYAGGQIGVWGLDVSLQVLKPPSNTDLMGYCGPNWVSDYNWAGMLAFRQAGPTNAPDDSGEGSSMRSATGVGLLIWGRISGSGAAQRIVLEPAFEVPTAGTRGPAAGSGAQRLDVLATDGSLLRSLSFETAEAADLPAGGAGERHFAFVLPLDAELGARLGGLRIRAGGQAVTHMSGAVPAGDPGVTLTRVSPQQVELRWDAVRFPMVLVREAGSGRILSFARGGSARIWSGGEAFELSVSNGIRSTTRSARVLR